MNIQIADYIDALEYESPAVRYREASFLIIGKDARVKPGTDDYYRLARMRLQAKKEIMGVSKQNYTHGFASESYEHNLNEYRIALK